MNESEESRSPKLSLLSRSSMWEWELPEAQGCKTPPIIAPLSIPFKWEEVPGKPKPRNDIPSGLSTSKSLHLPPRLLVHDHGSPPFVEAPTNLFALRSRSYSSRAECRKMESPTSILNSPPTSTTSSTSSHDIDELPRLHKHNLHKMRRLLDHWTSTLRWPKLNEQQQDHHHHHKSHCACQTQGSSFTAPERKKWVLRKMKRSSRVFGTILKRMRSRKEDSPK